MYRNYVTFFSAGRDCAYILIAWFRVWESPLLNSSGWSSSIEEFGTFKRSFCSVFVAWISGCKTSRILFETFSHTISLLLTVSFSITLFKHRSFNLGYIVLIYLEPSIRISLGICWTNDDIKDVKAT